MIDKEYNKLNTREIIALNKIVKKSKKNGVLSDKEQQIYDMFIDDYDVEFAAAKKKKPYYIAATVLLSIAIFMKWF